MYENMRGLLACSVIGTECEKGRGYACTWLLVYVAMSLIQFLVLWCKTGLRSACGGFPAKAFSQDA
eukprot:scaffold278134_cov19-Tisochrysis_lutea.AAC.1